MNTLITRKVFIIIVFKTILFFSLIYRLYVISILSHREYKKISRSNFLKVYEYVGRRGVIFDRNGREIAVDKHGYDIVIDAANINKRDVLDLLSGLVNIKQSRYKQAMQARKGEIIIKENLKWDELIIVEANAFRTPGIKIITGYDRYYPYGMAISHVGGYIGSSSTTDKRHIIGFKVGKSGIERAYNDKLLGISGKSTYEVDAFGHEVKLVHVDHGIQGQDITLTIDAELQKYMFDRMKRYKAGSSIVMDLKDGSILGMVAKPAFDPNIMSYRSMTSEEWKSYMTNDTTLNPFNCRAISGVYSPASIFKVITMLAALEHGIDVNTEFECLGHYDIASNPDNNIDIESENLKTKFYCWREHGHIENMTYALARSCDSYFYYLADIIGLDSILNTARKLGVGEKTRVEIIGEASGLLPNREWKKKRFNARWFTGDTILTAIGQGFLLMSPIQIATVIGRLVSNNLSLTPRFTTPDNSQDPNASPETANPSNDEGNDEILNPEYVEYIKQGMNMGFNSPIGTSYRSRIYYKGFAIAGKTGTSQVRTITAEERALGIINNRDLDWEQRDHSMVACFGPTKNPRYVCATVIDHGGFGSAAAAPYTSKVFKYIAKNIHDTNK